MEVYQIQLLIYKILIHKKEKLNKDHQKMKQVVFDLKEKDLELEWVKKVIQHHNYQLQVS